MIALIFSGIILGLSVAAPIGPVNIAVIRRGLAVGFFQGYPALAPEWRLFAVTGFLGGLTTFSTFSAEAMSLLQRGDYVWALGHSALHLVGSIAFCIAGYAAYRALTS